MGVYASRVTSTFDSQSKGINSKAHRLSLHIGALPHAANSRRIHGTDVLHFQEDRIFGPYEILERTQMGTLDITLWMGWFLGCLGRAFDRTETALATVLHKSRFWEQHWSTTINERQRLILNRMLDGFEGKLTSSKWAKIAKCSHDTALRDIQYLIQQGILVKDPGGGRSTSYSLKEMVE
jgi:hypothetical protein